MHERNMSIVFSSGIHSMTEKNSSFDSGILRVCYTGKNRNNSFISKETFEQCMPSIYNCPIVCRYDRETDTIGSHDVELVSDDSGSMRIVNVTHPVGVIPAGAEYWWEEIEDNSGLHEYLCVEALIWKRQEAYSKIKEDGITDESMEITVKDGEMVDGIYVIRNFEFTAFCLLGTAEPCYESASLEVFSLDSFKEQLAAMKQELEETFNTAQLPTGVDINNKNFSEGGNEVLEQKNELMAEYGYTADMLDFNIDELTLEELREKFEAMKNAAEPETAPATDVSAEGEEGKSFMLVGQMLDELIDSLRAEKVETCYGEISRYCYVDHDPEAMEVYCYDAEDGWRLYGFTYSMNGDNVVIDFNSKKRKKFSIVDFDNGEQEAAFAAVFEGITQKYNANNQQWEEKYRSASEEINSMKFELTELRKYKADMEDAALDQARSEVFERFAKLNGVEAFEALRTAQKEYTVEALEEKCYAICGRMGITAKFSLEEPKPVRIPVLRTDRDEDEPYNGIFVEYGFKAE